MNAAAGPRRPDTAAAAELFAGLAVRQTAGGRCAGAARCGRRRVGDRRFDVGAIAIGVHCPVGLAKEANDVAHDGDGGGAGAGSGGVGSDCLFVFLVERIQIVTRRPAPTTRAP